MNVEIEINDKIRELQVDIDYQESRPQTWGSPGNTPELEIIKIEDEDYNEITLSDEDMEQLKEKILSEIAYS